MVSAIIAAAGSGTRIGFKKQFMELRGIPLLAYSLQSFQDSTVDEIVVVTAEEDIFTVKKIAEDYGITKLKSVVRGGATRSESVTNGLSAISGDYVLIHDGARPFVADFEIDELIDEVLQCKAAALGYPIVDTVKLVKGGYVEKTVPREVLVAAATPQGFETELIKNSHKKAAKDGLSLTDDCSAAEYCGHKVKMIPCRDINIKITTTKDVIFAEAILEASQCE